MANYGYRPKDQAVCEFIDECIEQANPIREELEPGWFENWGNYRVESTYGTGQHSKMYPMATGAYNRFEMSPINFLKTPESHQGVNTLRALLLAALFGTRDYVQADPVGDEDIEKAKRVSRLVMYGLERPGNFRTNFECIGDALIFGLGSYTARWKNEARLVPRRMPVPDPFAPGEFIRNPQTGGIMTILQNVMAPVFDDPTLEGDDLFKTWFDPAANRFDELNWKCKLFQMRAEELETLQGDENWDGEGIAQVLLHPPDGRTYGSNLRGDHPKLITENLVEDDTKDIAAYGYYGGWMFEGRVPPEVAEAIGGIDHRGTVVLKMIDGICIQAIQSPQRNGHIQGGVFTILPTGRGVYGLSPLTIVRYLQDVSDTQLILTVQALIESVYQNYVVGGDWGPDFPRLLETRRPREVFPTQGEITQLAPLPKDYTGLGIAMQALGMMSQTMRNAMNARDPVQGIMAQGDTTATETNTVTQAALQNTDQLAVLIERDELPVIGRLINDLYYVNLDDEAKVFRRVGDTETTSVSYFDIDSVTDITFVGARSMLTRSQISNQFRDMATVLASNPFTMASTDWNEFIRRWGDEGFQVKGLENLMIKDPEEIVARMQSLGLANTVGPPGGAGKGAPPGPKGRSNPANGGGTGGVVPAQAAGEAA